MLLGGLPGGLLGGLATGRGGGGCGGAAKKVRLGGGGDHGGQLVGGGAAAADDAAGGDGVEGVHVAAGYILCRRKREYHPRTSKNFVLNTYIICITSTTQAQTFPSNGSVLATT